MNSRSRLAAFRNFGLSLGLPRFHPFPPGLLPPHLAISRPPGLPLSFPASYQLLPHPRHHHLLSSPFASLPQELLVPRLPMLHPQQQQPQRRAGQEEERQQEESSLGSSPPRQQQESSPPGPPCLGQESLLLLRARVMSTPGRGDSPPGPTQRYFIKAEPDLTD